MLKKKMAGALLAVCMLVTVAPAAFADAAAHSASGALSLLPVPLPPGDGDSGPVINPPGPRPPPR